MAPLLCVGLLALEALSLWDFLSCVRVPILRDALPAAGVGLLLAWAWASGRAVASDFTRCALRASPLLLLRLYPWFGALPVPPEAAGWLPDLSAFCLGVVVLTAAWATFTRLPLEGPAAPWRGALLLAVAHGALLYCLMAERHAAFANASTYYPHAFWNLAHGTWQETASDFDVPVPLFAVHFYVTAFLFVPWVWAFPTLDGIGALQAIVVAAGGIALARGVACARGERAGFVAQILYAAHPVGLLAASWGVTVDAFSMGGLAACIGAILAGRWRWAGVALALTLGCKESLVLVTVPLGLWAAFSLGRRRWGFAAVALSLVWFALAALVQSRLLGGVYGPGSYVNACLHLAAHPLEAVRHYMAPGRLSAWALLLAPVAFLPLRSWRLLLCAAPIVLVTLSNNDARIVLEEYHLGPAAVLMAVAAALAVVRASGPGVNPGPTTLGTTGLPLAACALSLVFLNPPAVWTRDGLGGLPDGPRREWLARKLKELPPDVSVSCTSELRAALGFRKTVFPFFPEAGGRLPLPELLGRLGLEPYQVPATRDAEVVVLDLMRTEHLPGGGWSPALENLLASGCYGAVRMNGSLLIMDRHGGFSLRDLARAPDLHSTYVNSHLALGEVRVGTEIPLELYGHVGQDGTAPLRRVQYRWREFLVCPSTEVNYGLAWNSVWPGDVVWDREWLSLPPDLRASSSPYLVEEIVGDSEESSLHVLGELRVVPRTLFAFPHPSDPGLDW